MTLSEFSDILHKLHCLNGEIHHYETQQVDYPYLVYFEYNRNHLRADNRINRSYDDVQVSYFTETVEDPNAETISQFLDQHGIVFDYKVIYQKDNGVFHHIFDCELI